MAKQLAKQQQQISADRAVIKQLATLGPKIQALRKQVSACQESLRLCTTELVIRKRIQAFQPPR